MFCSGSQSLFVSQVKVPGTRLCDKGLAVEGAPGYWELLIWVPFSTQ